MQADVDGPGNGTQPVRLGRPVRRVDEAARRRQPTHIDQAPDGEADRRRHPEIVGGQHHGDRLAVGGGIRTGAAVAVQSTPTAPTAGWNLAVRSEVVEGRYERSIDRFGRAVHIHVIPTPVLVPICTTRKTSSPTTPNSRKLHSTGKPLLWSQLDAIPRSAISLAVYNPFVDPRFHHRSNIPPTPSSRSHRIRHYT